jgi:hypothetical protein
VVFLVCNLLGAQQRLLGLVAELSLSHVVPRLERPYGGEGVRVPPIKCRIAPGELGGQGKVTPIGVRDDRGSFATTRAMDRRYPAESSPALQYR